MNTINNTINNTIIFFYRDKGEYFNLLPLYKEAQNRGYTVEITTDFNKESEIGVYCQHAQTINAKKSKFSLILLHDMAQGSLRWPNIWSVENWNQFDIGILPGKKWVDMWRESSFDMNTWPKLGVYELGYPKSDYVVSEEREKNARELRKKLSLKYEKTILYAPSWENDNKEHEFIESLKDLKVNLIIKQAHWSKEYQFVIQNIERMRQLHEGKYENLHYIDVKENIMNVLAISDLVVSDESSVMAEALIFGIPSISITDWLIPDVTPSRFANACYEYVYKCKKNEMLNIAKDILIKNENKIDIIKYKKDIFSLEGQSCKNILDLIDHYVRQGKDIEFMKYKVVPKYKPEKLLWN